MTDSALVAEIERDIAPILEEWRAWTETYSNEIDQSDALYWYNERATVGTLAAAAARRRLYVLEEYRTPKTWEEQNWMGRADLWIRCEQAQYVLEAKHIWVSDSTDPETLTRIIAEAMDKACADAKCHASGQGIRSLGAVFIVPRLPASRHAQRTACLASLKKAVLESASDLHAFAFPERGNPVNEQNYLYPGVACSIRACRTV